MANELNLILQTTGLTVTANIYTPGFTLVTGAIACPEIGGATGRYSGSVPAATLSTDQYHVEFVESGVAVGRGILNWSGITDSEVEQDVLDAEQPNYVWFRDGVLINPNTAGRTALELSGNGSGAGLQANGGSGGIGIQANGGASGGGVGMRIQAQSGGSVGLEINGDGAGYDIDAEQVLAVWQHRGLEIGNPKTITEAVEGSDYDEDIGTIHLDVIKAGAITTITRTT